MLEVNRQHVVGLVCLTVAGVVLAITPTFPAGQESVGITGPAFFPNVLAIVLILAGAYKIVRGFVARSSNPGIHFGELALSLRQPEIATVLLTVAMLVLYVLFFELLGFVLCTVSFLFVLMARLGVKKLRSALYAAGFTALIYLMFGKLFGVSLPPGVLGLIGLS